MRLVTKRQAVEAVLAEAGRTGRALFCPNAETVDEMEGVLAGAQAYAQGHGIGRIAVGIGVTGSYPEHGQLERLGMGSLLTAWRVWDGWLRGYAAVEGLFPQVEVIPFLDHGWAPHAEDVELMNAAEFQDAMGIVMFDASALSIEENIRLTRGYVERAGDRVVVEGCPDKILAQAEIARRGLRVADLLTDPGQAERFVRETGVDLIVPSLGTEHRGQPGEQIYYRRELARDLARRVGPRLALHGTSSLGNGVGGVGADGVCKVNYYTAMARAASGALLNEWTGQDAGQLPIGLASGSFIHATRRGRVCDKVKAMLELLYREDGLPCPATGPGCAT
jgi:fructose/tagatose bisphosphate aldolase